MAVYTGQLVLSNGQMIHICFAANQAVNTAVVADTNVPVVSGTHTQTDFSVASDAVLVDFTTDETAGTMELYNVTDGRATGLQLLTTAKYASSVATRPVPRIGFRAGKTYRWIMKVAGAA